MAFWQVRGHDREVSRSMVALVVGLIAALALGLTEWVPRALSTDIGVTQVEPGLLTVSKEATGIATLGGGYIVALYRSGLRVAKADAVMLDTVRGGAPLSVAFGRVELPAGGHPREHIEATLDTVRIDSLEFLPGRATYRGTVSGTVDGHVCTLPMTIRVTLTKGVVGVRADVAGADAIIWHLDYVPATIGIPPRLPKKNLRRHAWWVERTGEPGPLFTWSLRTTITVDPPRSVRAVDLTPDGRLDLHVWADAAAVTVSGTPRQP